MAQLLFVDPDLDSLTRHVGLARQLGHEAIGASTGMKAIEELSRNPGIALIVSELDLPDGTFEQLFQSIRSSPHYQRVPFLLLTNEIHSTRLIRLIAHGVENSAKKPISETDFRFLIARGLKCRTNRQLAGVLEKSQVA
ncbi:MAG: hypothetical protein JKY61_05995 [Planctomycetes bacterium]|nr:hypothetical protein [Planctomycetota bacterium]